MRTRHGARILLVRPDKRVLLFRFKYDHGPLAGSEYWAVPGGGVEEGETFPEAAIRELREETGICTDSVEEEMAGGEYLFRLSTGEDVIQSDHYFVVPADPSTAAFSRAGLTQEESQSLVEYRWWLPEEIRSSPDRFIPPDLADKITSTLCRSDRAV